MVGRKLAMILALAALVAAASGASADMQRWFVSGTLDETHDADRTIEVGNHVLKVTLRTRITRADGKPGDWGDIVARDGEHVTALVVPGRPHPVVEAIVLADDEEDE